MIYYFSATGNNQYVAERIAETLGDKVCSIVGADLLIRLSEGEALGIVAPTNMFWKGDKYCLYPAARSQPKCGKAVKFKGLKKC